jgi:secondary thiamine-phosphate synthase enzyme
MKQYTHEFTVRTGGPGAHEFTHEVVDWVRSCGIDEGLLTLHGRHTSASLLIMENADPEVLRDLERWMRRAVPPGDPLFQHTAEGPDDMPAHVRTALTPISLSIPVLDGRPALGTWQGIFVYEHRDHGHRRRVAAHLSGA